MVARIKHIAISALFLGILWPQHYGVAQHSGRELWVGHFEQKQPMPWKGEMLLYLRKSSQHKDRIQGVIVWKSLGGAKTLIEGIANRSTIRFTEKECVEGDCSKVFVGGNYQGRFDSSYTSLEGTAELMPFRFTGRFRLKRVIVDEDL